MVRRSTWILVVIFAGLVGFTWFYQKNQAKKSASTTAIPTSARATLYQFDSTQISEVKITASSGDQIDLYRDSATSQWAIKNIPADQADSFQIESVIAQLASIQILETLDPSLPLDSVGLAEPAYIINIKNNDSSQATTEVGSLTAVGSGYYARNNGGSVVIVDKMVMDVVQNLLTSPPLVATATPAVTSPTENEPSVTPTQ